MNQTTPRIVTAEDLERELERVRAAAAGEQEGVFGPRSLSWRLDREAITFLGAGRALLLQLAHPWVAAGVAAHSGAFTDPVGRFHRTFDVVFTLAFGTLGQALATARRLHQRHAGVRGVLPRAAGPFPAGSPYWANELEALRWVHATLADTSALIHDGIFGPLSPADEDRRWAEGLLYASLFGIPAEAMPADRHQFAAYRDAMLQSDMLTVTPEARQVVAKLFAGPRYGPRAPGWFRALTAHLLPPRLRDGFELAYGPAEAKVAERVLAWARRTVPVLPPRLRYVGPYHEAIARLEGRPKPDLTTRGLNRLWIGRARMGE